MVRVLAWTVEGPGFGICLWGTGVSGLTRGLATLPQGGSRSLRWSEIRMEDPQEDPLAMHCFCVCSGSVLLGDLLGVSRSRECDLLFVLFIYPRFLCNVQYPQYISNSLSLFYYAVIWCMFVALVELSILAPPPFRLTASVFVVLVMRKGRESSWSGPWHLGCISEVLFSMWTATRSSSYSPVGTSVFYLA